MQFPFQTCPAADDGLGEGTLVFEADAAQLHIQSPGQGCDEHGFLPSP